MSKAKTSDVRYIKLDIRKNPEFFWYSGCLPFEMECFGHVTKHQTRPAAIMKIIKTCQLSLSPVVGSTVT